MRTRTTPRARAAGRLRDRAEDGTDVPGPKIPNRPARGGRAYAIGLDLDADALRDVFPADPDGRARREVGLVLAEHGFEERRPGTWYGDASCDAVRCVLAAQDAARRLPWLSRAVRDMRMLRIEEDSDLAPALEAG